MTMSRFRVEPRQGHLDRLKHIYGYLRNRPNACIRFRTGIQKNEELFEVEEKDWSRSVYGNKQENGFDSTIYPTPKGKKIRISTFVDANLMACKVTGKSCTGILHLVNQTPVDWYSKMQATVESATYGSEFVAARIAVDQIVDIRDTLRAMGANIEEKAWLLGDNKSVVTSSTIPYSQLGKRHQFLCYHRVRSAVATGLINFCHIPGVENPSDVMTKFLPWATMKDLIEPLLFTRGETIPLEYKKPQS